MISGLRHRLVHNNDGTNWNIIADVVFDELVRIEAGKEIDDELLDNIKLITVTLNGMKEECEWTS